MQSTRREFLQTGAVISLGAVAPGYLLEAAAQDAKSRKETILVVVQMSGGNDGLNTIVPYADEVYRRSRPTLAIGADQVLKIDESVGFHPSLRGFADLLEAGKLAIVQGVGYANPNRSHFESMDIWHTCTRKKHRRTDGWLGRYLDGTVKGDGGDLPALHLGAEKQPLALAARDVRVPSVSSLERFRLQTGGNRKLERAIKELAAAERAGENELLEFIKSSTTSALASSRRVEKASKGYKTPVEYPKTDLAGKLRVVAQLIDAGLSTRIYYTAIDGFDTHSTQAAAHASLLNRLGGAINAFIEDVSHHGHGDRVVVMSFSEFGRRVKENASKGTDHGAAAPMILAGNRVKPGLIGRHPSLADLEQGDVTFHTDFRRVYASVLKDWLGFKTEPVLRAKYEPLSIFTG